eukprot:1156076-Pelagomonas_calceolata.AAC.3
MPMPSRTAQCSLHGTIKFACWTLPMPIPGRTAQCSLHGTIKFACWTLPMPIPGRLVQYGLHAKRCPPLPAPPACPGRPCSCAAQA